MPANIDLLRTANAQPCSCTRSGISISRSFLTFLHFLEINSEMLLRKKSCVTATFFLPGHGCRGGARGRHVPTGAGGASRREAERRPGGGGGAAPPRRPGGVRREEGRTRGTSGPLGGGRGARPGVGSPRARRDGRRGELLRGWRGERGGQGARDPRPPRPSRLAPHPPPSARPFAARGGPTPGGGRLEPPTHLALPRTHHIAAGLTLCRPRSLPPPHPHSPPFRRTCGRALPAAAGATEASQHP